MSILQINTAIPLAEPLLEHQQLETERSATRRDSSETNSGHKRKFVLLGALTGFFFQVMSFGARNLLFPGQIVYVLIWATYTCTAVLCIRSLFFDSYSISEEGNFVGKDNKIIERRDVFVLGIYFFVGIDLGSYGIWSAIDVYLGIPIPFKHFLTTVMIDLVLSFLMVWCYNHLCKNKRRRAINKFYLNHDSDDDEDCEPAMCC